MLKLSDTHTHTHTSTWLLMLGPPGRGVAIASADESDKKSRKPETIFANFILAELWEIYGVEGESQVIKRVDVHI